MAAHSSRSSLSRQIALRIPNAELDAIEAAARRNGLTRAGEIKRPRALLVIGEDVGELSDGGGQGHVDLVPARCGGLPDDPPVEGQ